MLIMQGFLTCSLKNWVWVFLPVVVLKVFLYFALIFTIKAIKKNRGQLNVNEKLEATKNQKSESQGRGKGLGVQIHKDWTPSPTGLRSTVPCGPLLKKHFFSSSQNGKKNWTIKKCFWGGGGGLGAPRIDRYPPPLEFPPAPTHMLITKIKK